MPAQIWLSPTRLRLRGIITRRHRGRGLCFSFRQFESVSSSGRALAGTDRGMDSTALIGFMADALTGADIVTGIKNVGHVALSTTTSMSRVMRGYA
jgi:hypothetical protein